ncbi:hypothetical protein ACFL6D_03650, partial [Spirochaetota bacterium]
IHTLEYIHNHPSLCFLNYGNELYEFLLHKKKSYDPVLEKYYDAHKEHDFQKRPSSGSSGRLVCDYNTKADFVDHHHYIGVYFGSYAGVQNYLDVTAQKIREKYGEYIPFTTVETGNMQDVRMHTTTVRDMKPLLEKEIFDKQKFIDLLTTDDPVRNWCRLNMNSGGTRCYITETPKWRERFSYMMVKRYLELYRMNYDITDGVGLNTHIASVATFNYYNNSIKPKPEPYPEPGRLVLAEPLYTFRRAFYPLQAFLAIDNFHIIPGNSSKAPIIIVNDSMNNARFNCTIRVRNGSNKTKEVFKKEGISLEQGGEKEAEILDHYT